jgi:hypothetical protein
VEGDENVVETEIADPVDFPVVLAGNYRYEEETREGMTVRVASYAMNRPKAFKKLTNLAFSVIKYYEGFLGPFPFRELNIIEINDYGWGQAPPGTLFITQEAFNPIMGEANQLFSGGVNHRFAHEIAHQYWGTVVKRPSWEEQWLEEAFAEYCAALFIRDAKGKGDYEMLVARWKLRAKLANDVAPIALDVLRRAELPPERLLVRLEERQERLLADLLVQHRGLVQKPVQHGRPLLGQPGLPALRRDSILLPAEHHPGVPVGDPRLLSLPDALPGHGPPVGVRPGLGPAVCGIHRRVRLSEGVG